jgi:hypothetical protein
LTSLSEYGIPFQRAIVRLAMVDDAFAYRAVKHIEPGYFSVEPLGWLWTGIRSHVETYRTPPSDIVLGQWLRTLATEKHGTYVPEVSAVLALDCVRDAEWVKAQLREFLRRNIFATAHRESASLFNENEFDEAYGVMAKAHDAIQTLDFEGVDRQWFFEEADVRQARRVASSLAFDSTFSTGIRDLDRRTDGGVKPGEVWCVFAYAKRCKTTWMLNQVYGATHVHRAPVLVINLEGKGSQWSDKLDSCFSAELYANVKRGNIDARSYREMHGEYLSLRRLCVIRTRNEWDTNILDIENEVRELRSQGFRPKLLVLDYMDLGRSRDKQDSETGHQVAFARDFKRFCVNEDLAAWSAWQAQRPKADASTREHVLTSAAVADAYAKVRIVDAWGSLNATDEEMKKNEMRVYWEGHRDAPVGETYWITNDLSRMRMVTASGVGTDPSKMGTP